MKKTIKIKFIGFWAGFNDTDNFIYNNLRKFYDIQITDNPDYLFYSTFCPNNFDYLKYDCVRIFYSGENVSPNFNECDYAIGFDNITYNDRFLNFPLFLIYSQLEQAKHKHENADLNLYNKKDVFCNYIVGNRNGMPERTEIFNLINDYKPVSSRGTYLNNTTPIADTEEKKLNFQNRCRFSITFESISQPGFVTEKILHGFASQTIPIYYGDESITEIFNPDSFINCHDYDNLQQVVDKVRQIEENLDLWLKMVSTPCFKNPYYAEEKWCRFENFLKNIFEQPLEKAYRRPLKFHAIRFSDDLNNYMNLKSDVQFQRFIKCKDNIFVCLALKLFGSK